MPGWPGWLACLAWLGWMAGRAGSNSHTLDALEEVVGFCFGGPVTIGGSLEGPPGSSSGLIDASGAQLRPRWQLAGAWIPAGKSVKTSKDRCP